MPKPQPRTVTAKLSSPTDAHDGLKITVPLDAEGLPPLTVLVQIHEQAGKHVAKVAPVGTLFERGHVHDGTWIFVETPVRLGTAGRPFAAGASN